MNLTLACVLHLRYAFRCSTVPTKKKAMGEGPSLQGRSKANFAHMS
jgi:hypothetical protein